MTNEQELNSQLQSLREELDRKVLQLMTIFESGKEIHSYANWELLTKNVLYTAMGHLGISEGGLLAPQQLGEALRLWQSRGLRPVSLTESFRLSLDDVLLQHLRQTRGALKRQEIELSFPKNEVLLLAFEVLVPGVSSRGVEFVLLLGDKLDQSAFTSDEIEYLSILCAQAAVVFENRDLVRQNIQAERLAAIGQALAGLSHDFRGVLNGLGGASRHLTKLVAQMADGQPVSTEMFDKWCSLLRANEKRLADLVEDILEYSKPRTPVRESCQINDLVRELVGQKQDDLSWRRVQVYLDCAPSLPTVKADGTRLFRALSNLLDNACDAVSPGTGTIQIRTRVKLDAVVVEVRDNGVGIALEHMPRLFDPLFTTKKGSEGTGFGLANVKKIVEEHGGTVGVISQPGKGSTFRIEVPLRDSSRVLEAGLRQEVLDKEPA